MAFSCASQLIRQQSGCLAPTLYTYENSGDIERVTTSTHYNAEGTALTSIQKSLISRLSGELESKVITINERSLTSAEETRYTDSLMERLVSSTVPTSDTVATATVLDGFTIEQSDHQGGNWSFTRGYNATGTLSTATDPHGITTSTQTDIAGRPIIQTDGEGNETSISYLSCCVSPATITDALGNTINYSYDIRNRKIAESPRRLVGGLEKPAEQSLPEGRVIYIGHASRSPSRLIFNKDDSISINGGSMSNKRKHYSNLPNDNILPNNISALLGCNTATDGVNSIANALSKHFRGTVIGSNNSINLSQYGYVGSRNNSFVTMTNTNTHTPQNQIDP